MDLHSFVGLAGAPMIERFVEYLKVEWKLSTYLSPVVALVTGLFLNEALAVYFHTDFVTALFVGLFTGMTASGWHEITTNN
jgi:enoyl-CoA hydratase/carnithine racemase